MLGVQTVGPTLNYYQCTIECFPSAKLIKPRPWIQFRKRKRRPQTRQATRNLPMKLRCGRPLSIPTADVVWRCSAAMGRLPQQLKCGKGHALGRRTQHCENISISSMSLCAGSCSKTGNLRACGMRCSWCVSRCFSCGLAVFSYGCKWIPGGVAGLLELWMLHRTSTWLARYLC